MNNRANEWRMNASTFQEQQSVSQRIVMMGRKQSRGKKEKIALTLAVDNALLTCRLSVS